MLLSEMLLTLTRVEVYCLGLQGVRVQEPKNIRLYSSNTNSIYPETETRGVDDSVFSITNSGRTITSSSTGGIDNDDATDGSFYEIWKYTFIIPEN